MNSYRYNNRKLTLHTAAFELTAVVQFLIIDTHDLSIIGNIVVVIDNVDEKCDFDRSVLTWSSDVSTLGEASKYSRIVNLQDP